VQSNRWQNDLQPFQRGLNIRKFKEYSPVGDFLIVKHEADAPDNGGEADALSTGQVVQNNFGFLLVDHFCYALRKPRPRR